MKLRTFALATVLTLTTTHSAMGGAHTNSDRTLMGGVGTRSSSLTSTTERLPCLKPPVTEQAS